LKRTSARDEAYLPSAANGGGLKAKAFVADEVRSLKSDRAFSRLIPPKSFDAALADYR
jgi:hypothetical protein